MSTNNANATGFNSSLDNGKEAIEALLTQQEESQKSIEAKEEQVVEEAPEELEAEATEEVEEVEELEDEEYDDELEEELEANQVEEEGEEQPSIYTISVDGVEQEVTLDELKSGYSRQSDYTRKTQELANQRKNAEAETNAVREERAIYTQLLDQMRNQLEAGMQNEPDWVALAENDPVGYNSQRASWEENKKKQDAVLAEQQRMLQQSQQEQMQNLQAQVQNEAQLLVNAIPEWQDPKKAANGRAELKQYAITELGFSENELNQIYDHRAVLAIRKAMLHDKTQESVKKKPVVATKAKVARPGTSNVPVTPHKGKRLRQRLAKSGKMSDATKVFESML
jgi:hypothetical protein|tara:strand:+ start:5339 stop:6355 length:1017 start_codon:yes stop_codon:yes gene_type:complete